MELKEYQKRCLQDVKSYLNSLSDLKTRYESILATDKKLASAIDFPRAAWEEVTDGLQKTRYTSKKNGLGDHLPNFCLKVPTGGGKTLLASHVIGLIHLHYLKKQMGLVLWIVPTNQIYKQTLKALRDREHPYRQILDINSGGKTLIVEKKDRFTPQDTSERLVILLLMLPSASRHDKERLKIFQDASGFDQFFPSDDQLQDHEELLKIFPNLDYFGSPDSFLGRQIKSSLGNTCRILRPLIVIDEGQKAYSPLAQDTITNLNPSIILELSATPPPRSSVLVSISGRELDREQMIKLDIHLINKSSYDWKDTLRDSIAKRDFLHQKSIEYHAKTGTYIRPICLIQVERTGKSQLSDQRFIHAEDAKAFLINCGISEEEIAIKSSEKDDIEGIDLLSPDCRISYIITKQALQEGWDCPFAYILAILTNPSSQNAITQLVGRILRQPYAKKTGVKELDESYIFCFQQRAKTVIESIRKGLQGEGLGDLEGNIVEDSDEDIFIEVEMRDRFKKFEGKVYLPRFVIQGKNSYRELSYEMDLLSRINWEEADLEPIKELVLSKSISKDETSTLSLSNEIEVVRKSNNIIANGSLKLDYVFVTRQIIDIVSNPWIAYQIVEDVFSYLLNRNQKDIVASNLVFIVEELHKLLETERDRLAKDIFEKLITDKQLCFFLQMNQKPDLPSRIRVKRGARKLTRDNGDPLQLSVFDQVIEDDFDSDLEKSIAIYLDEHEKLLTWHRNMPRQGYYVQGWKRGKIYSDFIAMRSEDNDPDSCSQVFVLESKGLHLKNQDTQYKKNIFDICNELGKQVEWSELLGSRIEFHVIFEDEWKQKINQIFA